MLTVLTPTMSKALTIAIATCLDALAANAKQSVAPQDLAKCLQECALTEILLCRYTLNHQGNLLPINY